VVDTRLEAPALRRLLVGVLVMPRRARSCSDRRPARSSAC
jgi:hypothetical protein